MALAILIVSGFLFCTAFAFLNRARGSKLYGRTSYTEIGRVVSMSGMALLCLPFALSDASKMLELFCYLTGTLVLWCTFAWDADWSAEIGNDASHSKLWGFMRMTAHGSILTAIFTGLGLAGYEAALIVAPFGMLQGVPYLVWGIVDRSTAIPRAEYTWGFCMGVMFFTTFMSALYA